MILGEKLPSVNSQTLNGLEGSSILTLCRESSIGFVFSGPRLVSRFGDAGMNRTRELRCQNDRSSDPRKSVG